MGMFLLVVSDMDMAGWVVAHGVHPDPDLKLGKEQTQLLRLDQSTVCQPWVLPED